MSGLHRRAWVGLAFLLLALLTATTSAIAETAVSPGQEAINQLFLLVLVPAIGIGILVMVLLTYAVVKFRARKGNSHGPANPKTYDRRLETLWTVIPALILLLVGIATFQTLRITDTIPQEPDVIVEVTGHQWFWEFNVTYPNGSYVHTNMEFTVKVGQVVKLVIRSADVAHSLYLPAFNLKVDAIPGRDNVYWFQPLRAGDYDIHCAEFCGVAHYQMLGTLHVVST